MTTEPLAARLILCCRAKNFTITTAESCTGGLIGAALTDVPGASAVFERGFITYANAAKTDMLGVPAGLLESVGAVSEAVARRMAAGAQNRAGATIAIAVTGIAGPGGGSPAKPVGTVWFGLAGPAGITAHHRVFTGDRAAIRAASVLYGLKLLMAAAEAAGTEPK
jgi:nicotinamide-nucleotide amidase